MWIIDSVAQEVVWTNEPMFTYEAIDDYEDDGFWSDAEDEDAAEDWYNDMAYDMMVEDAAMEAGLFGWDA